MLRIYFVKSICLNGVVNIQYWTIEFLLKPVSCEWKCKYDRVIYSAEALWISRLYLPVENTIIDYCLGDSCLNSLQLPPMFL